MLDLEKLEQIKRITIIALFSDDDLMDSLVLKGGNALDMIYGIAQRASLDLDFSIDKEFNKSEISTIHDKIRKVLKETFKAKGYEAFDIHFTEVPAQIPKLSLSTSSFSYPLPHEKKGFYVSFVDVLCNVLCDYVLILVQRI